MSVFFISDLHLTPDIPATVERYYHFIEHYRGEMSALYILGDFFEYWVGDDHLDNWSRDILSTLQKLNIPLYFIHGNRDFLLSKALLAQFSITLLEDNSVIKVGKQNMILAHGDQLCTDDLAYQAFRKQVRSPQWQKNFLSQPLAQRLETVNQLRQKSKQAMQQKTEQIMDVNRQAVLTLMKEKQANILIHGHTHRAGKHTYQHGRLSRYVLGDWHNRSDFLRLDTQSGTISANC